jgi:hypothetical protein
VIGPIGNETGSKKGIIDIFLFLGFALSDRFAYSPVMPRPANPLTQVNPIVEQFARRLGAQLERFITGRIEKELKGQRATGARRSAGRARRRRAKVLCYYPGCKNLAAPRFGMFCAALHKNLSKADKEKYRAERLAAEAKGGDGAAAKGAEKKNGKAKGGKRGGRKSAGKAAEQKAAAAE